MENVLTTVKKEPSPKGDERGGYKKSSNLELAAAIFFDFY